MTSRLIYLDFDSFVDPLTLDTRIHNIAEMCGISLEIVKQYATKRGVHCIVKGEWEDKKEITPVEMVCLQLLLGSDPNREALNLYRAHRLGDAPAFWQDRWNVLFSEKLED